jgi:hypothetical protein
MKNNNEIATNLNIMANICSIVGPAVALIDVICGIIVKNSIAILTPTILLIVVLILAYYNVKYFKKIKTLELMGITGCHENVYETKYNPQRTIGRIDESLYFMATGGKRWLFDDDVGNEFEDKIKIFWEKANKNTIVSNIRFLLLDPTEYKPQSSFDFNVEQNYLKWAKFSRDYKGCFEVKLYRCHNRNFRLQFENESLVVVSKYEEDSRNDQKKACVIVEKRQKNRTNENSFYELFYKIFNDIWEDTNTRNISEWYKNYQEEERKKNEKGKVGTNSQ